MQGTSDLMLYMRVLGIEGNRPDYRGLAYAFSRYSPQIGFMGWYGYDQTY